MALQSAGSGRIDSSFSDMSISGGGFGSSGHGLGVDVESFSSKPKGSYLIISPYSTKVVRGENFQVLQFSWI